MYKYLQYVFITYKYVLKMHTYDFGHKCTKYWPKCVQYVLVRPRQYVLLHIKYVFTYKYLQICTICIMVYVSCTYNTYIYVQYRICPDQYIFACICTYICTWIRTDTFIQEQKIFVSADDLMQESWTGAIRVRGWMRTSIEGIIQGTQWRESK